MNGELSKSSLLSRYATGFLSALGAVGIRLALDPYLGVYATFLPFALVLMLVARFAGRGPALLATAASTVGIEYFFVAPRHSFAIAEPGGATELVIFAVVGVLVSVFVGRMRESLISLEAAQKKLHRLSRLVDLSHDAIITADSRRVITGWNAGAREMYGWTEAEAIGRVIHHLLQSSNHQPVSEIDRILRRESRWDGELSHATRDGRRIEVDSRQVFAEGLDAKTAILEINRDISDRKHAEAVLRQSEERYRSLFEAMQEGFMLIEVVCDDSEKPVDWRYLDVNPAGESMIGRRREEIVGKTYREVFPASAREHWIRDLGEVALTGRPARVRQRQSAAGRYLDVIAFSPAPKQAAVVFTDVTEQMLAEDRLRHAQKMESVGTLAGGVAHDFNNLLTVILGNAASGLADRPDCEYLQAIVTASERAANLTRQLLAYAGKGQAVVQEVNLTQLVSDSQDLLATAALSKTRFTFDLDRELPSVEADPRQFQQVLMNLVINANEAIPADREGAVEISTGVSEITAGQIRERMRRYDAEPGAYVWLQVRDNGSGMSSATLARIFDPFFSTKFTGRGLGLAAVDGIVRSGKGCIDVQSAAGRGTTFRIYWPVLERHYRVPAASPAAAAEGRPATVLVVENEAMLRRMAAAMLTKSGFKVLEASDGAQALQVLAAAPSLPEIILLDLVMPVMTGDELLPILAQRYPGIKVVVSSAYPERTPAGHSPGDSVAAFLPKPYDVEKLRETIAEVLAA